MTASFLTDEHVPSVFITTLRSNGYHVLKAIDVFGEGTDDRELLEYCAENELIFITHDKKDFSGMIGETVEHAGIVIYTDPMFLRDDPDQAVRTLNRVLTSYPSADLAGERVWLDQWRS